MTAKPRQSLWTGGAALVLATVWIRCFEDQKVTVTSLVLLAIWAAGYRRSIPMWSSALIVATAPVIGVPLYSAAETARQYARGTARVGYEIAGYPTMEAGYFRLQYSELRNFHRVYRAFPERSLDCIHHQPFDPWDIFGTFVDIFGWWSRLLPRSAANGTFELLFHFFGPMPGAYVGPYPTKREALSAIQESASIVDAEPWAQGRFKVAGREIQLAPNVRRWEFEPPHQPVRVALAGGTCLLIHEQLDDDKYIRLVDLGGFGQFATYRYEEPGD